MNIDTVGIQLESLVYVSAAEVEISLLEFVLSRLVADKKGNYLFGSDNIVQERVLSNCNDRMQTAIVEQHVDLERQLLLNLGEIYRHKFIY